MKKLIAISCLIVAAASLNVGCSASASLHRADASKMNTATQVAYVSTPAK